MAFLSKKWAIYNVFVKQNTKNWHRLNTLLKIAYEDVLAETMVQKTGYCLSLSW